MNTKISVFVTCVEVITYLILYNLHKYTLKSKLCDNKHTAKLY